MIAVCAGAHFSNVCPQRRLPVIQQKHQCALDGGLHTAFALHCPKRKAQVERLEEAKRNRLTRFPLLRPKQTCQVPDRANRTQQLDNSKPNASAQIAPQAAKIIIDSPPVTSATLA